MVKGAELDIVVCVIVSNKETWCKLLDYSRHAKQSAVVVCSVCSLWCNSCVSLCGVVSVCYVRCLVSVQ